MTTGANLLQVHDEEFGTCVLALANESVSGEFSNSQNSSLAACLPWCA